MSALRRLAPGLALCITLSLAATLLGALERRLLGQALLEPLVLALLLGLALRSFWDPPASCAPGTHFAAKFLLEAAVVLLGAAVSAHTVLALGPRLLAGIVGIVFIAILLGYVIGRALRLSSKLALLIACGNAICGNSAIAAVAPVIGAAADDITAAIAFTAILGVATVLLLPLLDPILKLSLTQYGVLAGLSVYAVPQVLAATLPIGALSNQVGTVVKLVRVLMLGPVILTLSLLLGRPGAAKPRWHELLPWFILGFLALLALRSAGLVPLALLPPIKLTAATLTTISMAALGIGVDFRTIARAGLPVTAGVTISLLSLIGLSLALIRLLHIP